MAEEVILFIQQRCSKTGAPSALARLMGHPALKPLRPVLLTSTTGWLTEDCARRSVPVVSLPFSSSRSVWARLAGNKLFAAHVRRELDKLNFRPRAVIGNDHLEGLLTLAIAREYGARPLIFLRSSETTRRDFLKYGCNEFDCIFAVGNELHQRAEHWSSCGCVQLVNDGLDKSDFLPSKPKAQDFPMRFLVVGSESHNKGWQDFATAVDLLERNPQFPAMEFDFTGKAPNTPLNDMRLEKPRRSSFNFIGRRECFRDLVRSYDLVIHPSRGESFGLAMVETLAAGVPLFCSRVGVIEQIQLEEAMLFLPNSPVDLASKFELLRLNWSQINPRVADCQENIRRNFSMMSMAVTFMDNIV